MRVLFDGPVHVHYGFLAVEPDELVDDLLTRSRSGQRNGLCGAAVPGRLSMVTGLHTGPVPVRIEAHAAAPPLGAEWEDVVEVSVVLTEDPYLLTSFDGGDELAVPAAGSYRGRWCASGMDAGHDLDTADDDEPTPDRYLLQLWSAPVAPDAVVRQTSRHAAYWHGVAAATPPPPRPPTQAELQRAERQVAERDADDERRRRELEDLEMWGGRTPSKRLRGWGWRAAMLARHDRDLVDELAALTPQQLRAVATWAATRACERARVLDLPLVVEALDRVARGERLPALWKDWDAVWDVLVPPEPDDAAGVSAVMVTVHVSDHAPGRRPLAPEAAVIDAVTGAGKRRPGRAAVGAIVGLSAGADDLGLCLAEVRAQLGHLPPQ